jgi:hypothetical protein
VLRVATDGDHVALQIDDATGDADPNLGDIEPIARDDLADLDGHIGIR